MAEHADNRTEEDDMKTTPTELDREAAGLFKPAPGTRARLGDAWVRVHLEFESFNDRAAYRYIHESHLNEVGQVVDGRELSALDTDDPATLGCMLAQVEEAAGCTAHLGTTSGQGGVILHEIDMPGVGRWRDFGRGAVVTKAMVFIKANARWLKPG